MLAQFDLQVERGEALVITGPSGSGKSTLLNILAGTVEVDTGSIEFNPDDDLQTWHELSMAQRTQVRRSHIGYVHQFFNLIPTLTVAENVRLVLELNRRRLDAGEFADIAADLLQRCGISHRRDAFPEQLSGGEQQRTAVARALAHRPALILADEPTGNLDRRNAEQVADLLFEACRAFQTTLVVATHSEEVAARADRVLNLPGLQE